MKVHETIKARLNELAYDIEENFNSDCILLHGQIHAGLLPAFGNILKDLSSSNKNKLVIILQTSGGTPEATEKLVEIMRHFYNEVIFIVPRYAMSAGTILCMSGDKLIMDYESSLGPIDPQVFNGKDWVPAQGYLDLYEKLIEKSQLGTISPGEFQKLINIDLADLSRYEQAKNLTETLLQKWLIQYKFKNWILHGNTDPSKFGQPVTIDEKKERAKSIADKLGDNSLWHSHGRYLGPNILNGELNLDIDDYPSDNIKRLILEYNDTAENHMNSKGIYNFFHTRNYY